MKKLLLAAPLLAVLTPAFAVDMPAMDQATMLAGGAPASAVMDGGRGMPGATPAPAPSAESRRTVTTGSGATLTVGQPTTGVPPAPEAEEPGFFSKALDFVKKPSFLVPGGMALTMGAVGAMMAGPLGAITGALIGGLLGFIVAKAMG